MVSTKVSSKRKMLAARADLADKVSKIAENRGFTVFSMVNDLLDLAIKVDEMGISLQEAVDSYELAKDVRDASFVLVFESLLYDTVQVAYEKAGEKTLEIWHDAGSWAAQRYLARGILDPLAAYERDLKVFAWNVPDITLNRSENNVNVRILSPRFSESYTVLFSRYIEGFLEACGYKITFNEVGRGNIRLEATKKAR